jgi:hypothetical protein
MIFLKKSSGMKTSMIEESNVPNNKKGNASRKMLIKIVENRLILKNLDMSKMKLH